MKIAFKKGFHNWQFDGWYAIGIILNNFIRLDFSSFVHAELVFSNGLSFSSVEGEGSRFKKIEYSHPEYWEFVDWDIHDPRFRTYKNENQLTRVCVKLSGRNYDWEGIIGQAIGNEEMENPKEFFCSEIIAFLMGIKGHPRPSKLYKEIERIKKEKAVM